MFSFNAFYSKEKYNLVKCSKDFSRVQEVKQMKISALELFMLSPVIVKARKRIAQAAAQAASGPARRGQGGRQCGHPGGTVIAPGLTRRQRLRAPPSISIQLVKLSLDWAGGQA